MILIFAFNNLTKFIEIEVNFGRRRSKVKLILSRKIFICSKFLDDLRLGGTDYIDREFFINPLFFIIIRDWIDNRNSVIEDMILSYEFNHFIFYLAFMRNIEVEVRLCLYRYKYIFIKLFFESLKKRRFFFFYYKSKVSFLYFHYSVSYQIYLNISNKRYREQ